MEAIEEGDKSTENGRGLRTLCVGVRFVGFFWFEFWIYISAMGAWGKSKLLTQRCDITHNYCNLIRLSQHLAYIIHAMLDYTTAYTICINNINKNFYYKNFFISFIIISVI